MTSFMVHMNLTLWDIYFSNHQDDGLKMHQNCKHQHIYTLVWITQRQDLVASLYAYISLTPSPPLMPKSLSDDSAVLGSGSWAGHGVHGVDGWNGVNPKGSVIVYIENLQLCIHYYVHGMPNAHDHENWVVNDWFFDHGLLAGHDDQEERRVWFAKGSAPWSCFLLLLSERQADPRDQKLWGLLQH